MRPSIQRAHAWILRGGTLVLLLPATAATFAAPVRGITPVRADATPAAVDESAEERAPTWAPATLVGEVLVKSDSLGRLAIVVDEALQGWTSRGAATRLFILTPETPISDPVEVHLPLASVRFLGESLTVSSPTRRFTVDIALASRSDGRRELRADGIVLHDGIALQSLRLAGPRVALKDVAIEGRPPAIADAAGTASAQASSCQAGGEGASTCTKKCSLGFGSASFIDECSVTCTAGHHACCNCIVPREGATCVCVKDEVVGPRPPGGVKVDAP